MGLTNLGFGFNGGGSGGGGSPGPAGTPGSVWRSASGVPSNSLGINGDFYLNNDDGFVYRKIAGVYVFQTNIKGANGTNGTDGSVWYAGNGAPISSPSFNANDFYLNNLNGDVFRYDGVAWQPETNIKGTNGTNGSVWYADNGFPPPAGSYNANDFYLDNASGQVYQFDGISWNPQVNISGTSGSQWFTGAGAPSVIQNDGDFFLDATTGDIYQQIAGSWTPTGTNIKGANGTNGTDGSIWYSGAIFPPTSPPTYNVNDFFLDTTNGNVYQYDGSLWQYQLTLLGVAGSTWYNDSGVPTTLYNDGDYYLDDLTGDVYTQVLGAWTGPVANILGPVGPAGAAGADGQDGASSSYFFYRTKTTITSGDPAAQHIRWNDVTPEISATELGISVGTDDNVDITIFLQLLQTGDSIIIQDKDVSANFQTWQVNGTIINNTTWFSVPVIFINSGGTGTTNFGNNLEVIVAVTREGTAGMDGANSTRYGFDSSTTPPTTPSAGRFNADNTDISLVTSFIFDEINIDGGNFATWWQALETWTDTIPQQNNLLQIKAVGGIRVGTYYVIKVTPSGSYFQVDVQYIAGVGLYDASDIYSVSWVLAGLDATGAQGVAGPNTDYWRFDTADPLITPPPQEFFGITSTGLDISDITSFVLNDEDLYQQNQFNWLEFARITALAGNVGFLSVTPINTSLAQSIFTISSIVDNGGEHTINVAFLGGYDVALSNWNLTDIFAFSYVFNGSGGGGTITVKYPNNSTVIDSAVNSMVFTGSGVTVTPISAGNVEINIPTSGTFGAIVASIRSLSVSTTLSPFTVGALTIPYNGIITGWTIFSDISGSCTVDFKSSSYASYPPTATIFSGNAPNLISAVKNELTGLSIAVTQGDILLCDLTAITGTMSRIDVTLLITKL